MRAVVGLLTADGRRGTSINGEFEAEDGKLDASAIETVPVRFDDCNDSLTGFGSNVKANNKVLFEFWKIAGAVPNVDVGANVGEGFRRMTNGGTELFEFKYTVVDIVAVGQKRQRKTEQRRSRKGEQKVMMKDGRSVEGNRETCRQ
jgi:hypothetical protein